MTNDSASGRLWPRDSWCSGYRRPWVGPAERLREHWRTRGNSEKARNNPRFSAWLCSLSQPPEYYVLQTVPCAQGEAAERYWTDLMRQVIGADLLNIKSGSASVSRRSLSPEHRATVGAGVKAAHLRDPGYSKKLSAAHRNISDETRARMSASAKARSLESRLRKAS
jgi:hypothetical protein